MRDFNCYYGDRVYDKYEVADANRQLLRSTIESWERYLKCTITPHFHPYATRFRQILQTESLRALMDSNIAALAGERPYFEDSYQPTELVLPGTEPVDRLEFSEGGAAYASYNWELFFHAPLAIAIGLSRSQRFQEAIKWFHFIFDPTRPQTVISETGAVSGTCWRVKPFRGGEIAFAHDQLLGLALGEPSDSVKAGLEAWRKAPFRPDAVARTRPAAYMMKTVMAYLDNLIAWGDSLFREDTRESINEASLLYVTAANILGTRPQVIPKARPAGRRSYYDLRQELDSFSNIAKALETELPMNELPLPTETAPNSQQAAIRTLGRSLYFGVPPNDKLLSYWDIVADRLFKIRNSLNLKGIFRQLPLFAPPIDPALLVKAAAAGLDVAAIAAGVGQALPLVRFRVLLPKAFELCQEVKSLGAQLLAAMEKRDAERLGILRAQHETAVLSLAEDVRYRQLQEAKKTLDGTKVSLANAFARYKYYERLLGEEEANLEQPELDELDLDSLRAQNFTAEEPQLAGRRIDVSLADGETTMLLSPEEKEELELLADARKWSDVAGGLDAVGAGLAMIPTMETAGKPFGVGVAICVGGPWLRAANSAAAAVMRTYAANRNAGAGIAARKSGHLRRAQEWAFQSSVAAGEVNATIKQLRVAQLRESIAELEWKNHQQQIKFAEDVHQFLEREKQTGEAFYVWMKNEVKGLHSRCYELAYDVARKAERALCHELGDSSLSFIKPSYLGGTEGLLAGEKLFLDLKRMELAYQDLNGREYELTKHISLLQLDPGALVRLRTTGECEIVLPESLFDLDGPGHYFRRIKSVSLSIPCVTGPYAGVNCQLTQTRSSIRVSALLASDKYERTSGNDDSRFVDIHGNVQSIVTSTAINDSGLFEPNLQDERYLPFEGTGAADSTWRLKLPEHAQFDYDTIADVVLHVRYTAREGGARLRAGACASIGSWIEGAGTFGLTRLFSLPHEFPTEWKRAVGSAEDLSIELRAEHYPYWLRDALHVTKCELMIASSDGPVLDFWGLGIEASGVEASNGVYRIYPKSDEEAKDSNELALSREGSIRISGELGGLENLWLLVTVKKAE